MIDRIQYNAAVKYIEKNTYRVNKSNVIFFLTIGGLASYFIILFFLKILSCL